MEMQKSISCGRTSVVAFFSVDLITPRIPCSTSTLQPGLMYMGSRRLSTLPARHYLIHPGNGHGRCGMSTCLLTATSKVGSTLSCSRTDFPGMAHILGHIPLLGGGAGFEREYGNIDICPTDVSKGGDLCRMPTSSMPIISLFMPRPVGVRIRAILLARLGL